MQILLSDHAIREMHKRAHGLTPESPSWADPRFDPGGEWDINPQVFRDATHDILAVGEAQWRQEMRNGR